MIACFKSVTQDYAVKCLACIVQLRLQENVESLLINLLQADDVCVEAKQLM